MKRADAPAPGFEKRKTERKEGIEKQRGGIVGLMEHAGNIEIARPDLPVHPTTLRRVVISAEGTSVSTDWFNCVHWRKLRMQGGGRTLITNFH